MDPHSPRVAPDRQRASPGSSIATTPCAPNWLADGTICRGRPRRRARHTGCAIVINAPLAGTNVVRLPPEPLDYASKLYGVLHALDEAGCEVIVVERVPDGAEWLGVRDRLSRASDL
jgi:L-threonylcarbamoyladenylate synthase